MTEILHTKLPTSTKVDLIHNPQGCWVINSDTDRTALDQSGVWFDPCTTKIPDHPPKTGLGPVCQARTGPGLARLPVLAFLWPGILVRARCSTVC